MATAKIDIWMPIYIGDYLRDTQALTAKEHGVYFLLLMHYWQKKGEIGTDVKRLAIVARSDFETTKTILESFFILDGENYKNKRADEELKAAKSRSNAARTNIQKRWYKDGNTGVIPPYKDGNTGGGTESIPIGYSSSPSSSPSLSVPISIQKEDKDNMSRFKKPTLEQVREEIVRRGSKIDPESFFAFYEARDWYSGKTKIKRWKNCITTWEKNGTTKKASDTSLKVLDRSTLLEMEE